MYVGLDVKKPFILSDSNETWIFSIDFRNVLKYKISSKSVQWEQRFFLCGRTDRQTDVTELMVAFSNFVNAPKNTLFLNYSNFSLRDS